MNRKMMIGALLGTVICLSGCGTDTGVSAPLNSSQTAVETEAATERPDTDTTEERVTETKSGDSTAASGQTESTAAQTTGTAASERLFGGYVALSSGSLNLRSEPNDKSDKLTSIPAGTQLDVFPGGVDGWYRVTFEGQTGYVSAKYIRKIEDDDTHAQTTVRTESPKPKPLFEGFADGGEAGVDLLQEPKADAKTIGKIPNGTSLEFCDGGKPGWYFVHYNGRDGYVQAEYAKEYEETRPPVSDAKKKAVEPVVGMWFESEAMFARTLVISEDGGFQLDYRGGGSLYGMVTAENSDGETWFCFYDEENELWGRFRKTVEDDTVKLLPDNEDDPAFEHSLTDENR